MLTYFIRIYLITIQAFLQLKIANSQCSGTPMTINVGYEASSFKYPETGEYGTNLQCEWLLSSSVSGTILYKSTDIDIDCSDSYSIYDGSSAASPAKDLNICTTGSPFSKPLDRSSGQNLFLRFTSDGTATSGKDIGFTIYFVSSPDLSSCSVSGSSISLKASQEVQAFTSPSFPSNYPLNHQCTWTISPLTPGANVTLSLYYIDIDFFSGTCYDKLTINDGSQTSEVCGDENFSPTNTYTNEGNGGITVTFTSDGTQVESGFVAVYIETGGSSSAGSSDGLSSGIIALIVIFTTLPFGCALCIVFICVYKVKFRGKLPSFCNNVYNKFKSQKSSKVGPDVTSTNGHNITSVISIQPTRISLPPLDSGANGIGPQRHDLPNRYKKLGID